MRGAFLRRIVLAVFAFLFVNSSSFSQNATIAGSVKHGNKALPFATVSIGNNTTLTNKSGEFRFSAQPGSYTLVITHVGYKKIEQTITVNLDSKMKFEFDMMPNDLLGEVVVLGSRSLVPRSNLNSPVPVDAFASPQLQQTGQTSLAQMLSFTAPSLNASMQNATEPVTLRGLYPDQILILLNGTRYNNTAFINTGNLAGGIPARGQLGRGAVTNDLNSIPFSAIEKVEILRDGASAQYGSDAVAGVINIILKESTGKTSVSLHLGQQYKGDGQTIKLGVNNGVALNKKGFLNYSADFRFRNPTFRGGEYEGLVYKNYVAGTSGDSMKVRLMDDSMVLARGFDRKEASNAGNAKLASLGILMNGAYPISSKTRIFWTGALNNSTFTFVYPEFDPNMVTQVNTALFPDGFKSRVTPYTWNVSGIARVKGVVGKEIFWEFSSAYGSNSSKYYSENTNNASQQSSLGKNAPTNFYTAYLRYQQLTNTVHFTKNYLPGGNKLKSVNLDWGGELRLENFRTKPGEEDAWQNFDSTGKKNPGAQNSLVVQPRNALNKSRNVWCTYIDLEGDFKDRLLINVAGRFEHYSDFGSNIAGKLAARYKLGRTFSIRGSVSNGFRAPSMQQRYWAVINNGFIRAGSVTTPTTGGIFNNEDEVTKVFGVPPLVAEKSLNFSGGLTSTLSRHIYLTIDGYWIQVRNRVVLGGVFNTQTDHEVDSLLKTSSLRDSTITRVSFFSNAINTRTKGIDLVLHAKWNFNHAQFIAALSANFTRTQLFGDIKTAANLSPGESNKNTLFNREQISNLEDGQPRSKIILSLEYKREKIGFVVRNTRFGGTAFQHVAVMTGKIQPEETFAPKILTDLAISYTPKSFVTITAGANNIFDVYPDRIKNYENTNSGLYIYAMEASPFGFNGGYYFVDMSFNF